MRLTACWLSNLSSRPPPSHSVRWVSRRCRWFEFRHVTPSPRGTMGRWWPAGSEASLDNRATLAAGGVCERGIAPEDSMSVNGRSTQETGLERATNSRQTSPSAPAVGKREATVCPVAGFISTRARVERMGCRRMQRGRQSAMSMTIAARAAIAGTRRSTISSTITTCTRRSTPEDSHDGVIVTPSHGCVPVSAVGSRTSPARTCSSPGCGRGPSTKTVLMKHMAAQ